MVMFSEKYRVEGHLESSNLPSQHQHSFFGKITASIKLYFNRRAFYREILKTAKTGSFSSQVASELKVKCVLLGLDFDNLIKVRAKAYRYAYEGNLRDNAISLEGNKALS